MTVNAINGKQGFVNLETADISESPNILYMTLAERQQIIKLENQIQDVRAHTFDKHIHLDNEFILRVSTNTEHRLDDSIHISSELKKKLKEHLDKLHGDGRRGLQGLPGPAGLDGSILNLSSVVLGTTNQITVTDNGDGSVTLSLSDPLAVGSISAGTAVLFGIADGNIKLGNTSTLADLTTGDYNIAIGDNALQYNETGEYNIAIGRYAMAGANATPFDVDNNVAVGSYSLFNIEHGSDKNTCLGFGSGYGITTGSNNILLGWNAGYRQTTNNNLLILDNQVRASIAEEGTNSIIYGVMAATPASQILNLNAVVNISQDLTVDGGTSLGDNAADTHNLFGVSTLGDGGTTNYLGVNATGGLTFYGSSKITGLKLNIVAKTAAYTATATDDIITCGAGDETFTVDLPAPVIGKIFFIKNVGTGIITVDADTTGSTTIDGETTQTVNQYECLQVICDASVYWIV